MSAMVEDCILRDAAIRGEESIVRRLVHGGADANAIIGAIILGAVRCASCYLFITL